MSLFQRQSDGENKFSLLTFLVYSDFQPVGRVLLMLRRTICFAKSGDPGVNLIEKHPGKHTQNNI
jgi:hypothetical protein